MTHTLRTLALALGLLGAVQLVDVTPAAAQAIITNDTVTLGVNPHGHLNVPGPASPIVGTPRVGLRFNANGWEALAHRSPCEGWGVGVATVGITGWANECFGEPGDGGPVFGLTLRSFTFTGDSATSEVTLRNPFPPFQDLLFVTHRWAPSAWPTLYQGNVRIANVNGGFIGDATTAVGDIRYRRVMDWDHEPTTAEELVTIGGIDGPGPQTPAFLLFSSDDGFEIADPLRFELGAPMDLSARAQAALGVTNPVPCGFTQNFTACGRFLTPDGDPFVVDHGALFDFAFPALGPGAAHEFAVFYGAAATREEAELALYQVGAEVYSLANCRPLEPGFGGFAGCDLATGAPTTFIFAAAGVGGSPVFGDISGTAYQDTDGNGTFDGTTETPLAGVTVMVVGTDLTGRELSRTTLTLADGSYVFAAMPRGSYAVSAPAASGALVRSTASPLAVTVGGTFPYVTLVDFGYVAAAAVRGTVYTDVNGSGAFEAGTDTPLAGVTVTLTGAGGARTTVTAADGGYLVEGLVPGAYTSSAPAEVGGQPLVTPASVMLTLGAGQEGVASFGYRTVPTPVTAIGGTVYTDTNRNHELDPGDTPLAGVSVTLTGPGGVRTATTGADGTYAFGGLTPGRYRVGAPPQVGGQPRTTPNPVTVTLGTGQARVVNFGYKKPPTATLHGVVYTNVKGHTPFNPGKDTPLAGVTVTLTGPGGTTTTAVTGTDGRYQFADLLPGVYMVSAPGSVNGQPRVTPSPVTRRLHGGRHRVDFGYQQAPSPDCKTGDGRGHDRHRDDCKGQDDRRGR